MGTAAMWHRQADVQAFIAEMFAAFGEAGVLAKLAQIPVDGSDATFFSALWEPLPEQRSLKELLAAHAGAARVLCALTPANPFETCLQLLARGEEVSALETLQKLGVDNINSLSSRETRAIQLFLTERLRCLPLEPSSLRRFWNLCHELHMFVVCSGNYIPGLAQLYFRAGAQAVRVGERNEAALFDLRVGALNVCNTPEHNDPHFHAIMKRGKEALERLNSPDLLEAAAPDLGIFYFLEGNYDQAMILFSRVSRKLRVQERNYFEMFYARHWGFAAANRGNFDLAESLLLSRLRQASVNSDASLSRSVSSQLASLYLRQDKTDKALAQLDRALTGITGQSDITSAVTTIRHLAYYHMLNGNLNAAHNVLQPVLQKAASQGYQRPLYLNGMWLELLAALDEQGLPPLPCYSFEDELQRCLTGPNQLLRGIACRVSGRRREREGHAQEAQLLYRQGIDVLDSIHNLLEADKTRLCLARMLLRDDPARATLLVSEAWPSYACLKTFFWPQELLPLIPTYLRSFEESDLSGQALLEQYRDSFAPQGFSASFDEFARMLLSESGRITGADGGRLYLLPQPSAGLRLVAQNGNLSHDDVFPTLAALEELFVMVAEGDPVILTDIGKTDSSRGMLVGIPIDCRPHGIYALCHSGGFSDAVRAILNEKLLLDIGRVLAWSCMKVLEVGRAAQAAPQLAETGQDMIWASSEMSHFLKDVDNAAASDAAVLLHGESGVGKEMLARRIHHRSGRGGRLVSVNMASLQDELFESEFFGHEKGAFTGAMNSKIGLVELADNGTLFLDELTEASPRVQAKLLRVLQERTFLRVGGTSPISINFRLVAASNRNLAEAVHSGAFRADLYYRVAVLCLRVPPLRERTQDILPLARYYLHYFAHRHRRECVSDFSEPNRRLLEQWPWPGNVRELRNLIEQSVILSGGNILFFHEDFISALPRPVSPPAVFSVPASPSASLLEDGVAELSLEAVEKLHIQRVLQQTNWCISGRRGALALLKISRSALYAKIRKYGLNR